MAYTKTAQKGCMWVLTEKGYEATPDHVKHEREIGKPIQHFKESVPTSWIEKEWVVEVKFREEKWMVNCDDNCLFYKDGTCSRDIAQHDEKGDCIDRKERSVKILISGEGYKTRQLLRNYLNSKTDF